MRILITGLLMAIWLTPSYARMGGQEMIWLEPLSYQKMREMRDKAKEMAKSKKPMGAERTGERPSDGKKMADGEKKKSWSSDGPRLRKIYIRSGAFPAKKRGMGMSHMSGMGGMKMGSMSGMSDRKMSGKPGTSGMPGGKPKKMMSNASGTKVWLERPDDVVKEFEVTQRRGSFQANYLATDGGWYRVFAYNDLGVRNESWVHLYSYYSFMSHGDKADEKERQSIPREGYYDGNPQLELDRVYTKMGEAYRSYVGDKVRVRAMFRGVPVAMGRITLMTEQGWKQTQKTDAMGDAVFTLIKEDFQEGSVDRRKSEKYLFKMEYKFKSDGEYQGVPYSSERHIATLPFSVYPTKSEWQSQRMAFLVIIITIIGAAVAIAIRRRRRRQK